MRRLVRGTIIAVALAAAATTLAAASGPGADVRLSNDIAGGYTSAYTLAGHGAYSDGVLAECSRARGRQNEPSVAIDPRNTDVIVGSSNDYCGVFNTSDGDGTPLATGPIWLGYYRSQSGGTSFQSSLVPGYPGDTSPYAALADIRCASSGDPVLAWDTHGRLFVGSECSEDPTGSKKGFGDQWVATYGNSGGGMSNDGKEYLGTVTVAKGSSAPGVGGKFNDKTAIEVDRTGGGCDGNVYFAWSEYNGNGGNQINFVRSTDHGRTFSKPMSISSLNSETQGADIAVTGNGHVYVTFRHYAGNKRNVPDSIQIAKSIDCGRTFTKPGTVKTFTAYSAEDVAQAEAPVKPVDERGDDEMEDEAASSSSRDCGSLDAHCASNYVFFRHDTQVRSTADQGDHNSENVFMVLDPSVPGTEVSTGTTYGSEGSGTGSQEGVYFIRYNGASGAKTDLRRIAPETKGHQLFPDIAVDAGVLHALWWDTRNDDAYSPARPIGNYADGSQSAGALDVYASTSTDGGATWADATRLSDFTSRGNWEQFGGRTVPFGGDYLWIDAQGGQTYGTWTDWRNTAGGDDAREPADDKTGADVKQCRAVSSGGIVGPDTCPRAGGLDQDIYGDHTP